jgi:hypothetical protein
MAAERGQRGGGRGATRGRGGAPVKKKKDDGGSILGAVATPFEWLVNTVSRPAYSVGSLVAGNPANAAREMAALLSLGLSEKIPGMDAPETTVSQALQGRGVKYPGGIGGFALRFGTDLITDPTSYFTLGASGAVRGAARAAATEAGERAGRDAAAIGLSRRETNALVQSARRGARAEVRQNAPRQFAVNFAPVGVTLARRGAPLASKDITLGNSAFGRQLDALLDNVGKSKIVVGAQRTFATGGDPAKESRVVDEMIQAVRQQADKTKNFTLTRVLRRQGKAFDDLVRANKLDKESASRSVGAYLLARADAPELGTSHASAYANYVRNAKDAGIKTEYLPFATVERLLRPQITFADQVARSTAKAEVKIGVKTADDIIENYVPRIARKGSDVKKVDKIEGWTQPTTALRSSTTQKRRVLRTSDEWFKNGLVPEDDYFRLADWRMKQSVDLVAQQVALNSVSSRFGRVLDENEIIGKMLGRQGKALEKFQRAANVVAKAEQAQGRADADVVQRNLAIGEARSAREAAEATRAQQIGGAEGQVNIARGLDRENPLPTQRQAAREAADSATGPTFADLQAFANEKFTARQMTQMARNEYARRLADVQAGLDSPTVLRPYVDFIARAEAAVKTAARRPAQIADKELAKLKSDALSLLAGEKSARRSDLKKAQQTLRAARRTGNKVRIERAKALEREARLRLRMATDRQQAARTSTEQAKKRLDNRARILDERTADVRTATAFADRSLKTPGARASAEEMTEWKKQGWQQLQYDYDAVVAIVPPSVREGVDRAFQKAWEVTTNQGAFTDARRFINGATSRWKGLSLISVGYHMRNLQSDLMMAFLAGAKDPRSIVQAVQIMRGRSGSMVIDGKRMSYSDILREAENNGTIRAGEVSADAGRVAQQAERAGRKAIGPPRVPGEGSVAQGSYRFGRFREDSTRLMLYIERRKAGDTVDEAAEAVRSFLFDYGDTSRFVSTTRRFMFPFITWGAKALPRMLKQAVEKPRTFTRIGFATDAANESFGPIDPNLLPVGRTLSFAIPTMGLASRPYTFNPENSLPYGVVNSFNPLGFRSAGRSVGSFLNPIVKTPIELATNYNLYQGRTAPRRVQAPVWIRALSGAGVSGGPLDIGDKRDLYTKQTVPGYSRAWDSIFRMFPPYQLSQAYPGVGQESDRIGYLRSIFGVNVSPYERQRDLFYAQKFAPKA